MTNIIQAIDTHYDSIVEDDFGNYTYDDYSNIEFDEFGVATIPTKFAKKVNNVMDFYEAGVDAFTYMQNVL